MTPPKQLPASGYTPTWHDSASRFRERMKRYAARELLRASMQAKLPVRIK